MAQPIWKDYFVDLGAPAASGAGVPFYIYSVAKSETIYTGVSYPKPGAASAEARINDVCADYLARYFMEQPDATMPPRATFRVYVTTSGSAVLKDTVEFYNDWSYDPYYNPSSDGQNFPVVPTFAQGQFIPVTLWSGSVGTFTVYMPDGRTYTAAPVKYRAGDFNNDFNDDFLLRTQYFGDSYMIPMGDYPGAARVTYKGRTWYASTKCPQYVLYYANAYGGWDSLPVEGKDVRADSLTRYTTGLVYDNSSASARGKDNYLNDIKRTAELWTGWLNADQSSRMHHLLNSTAVYLHDMETGLIHPVVLTSSTTEYKNARGLMYAYKIEAELAQERLRR